MTDDTTQQGHDVQVNIMLYLYVGKCYLLKAADRQRHDVQGNIYVI